VGVDLFTSGAIPDPFVGQTLDGRYQVLERMGVGGVGVVYRGRQVQLGRFVAIKVLHQHTAAQPEWRRRFEREAKALSALAHPNVVTVTDSGIADGVPYLVMELLQGKTLADLIKKEAPLPAARALDIARQTLRGLAFAHGKGIVHRDLKPANIFLQALPDQADHVRLLDFGMAKFLEGAPASAGSRSLVQPLTRIGAVVGTPAYMSPEQARSEPVDARADVYAAGVVLFELFAGRTPFVRDTLDAMLKAHVTEPIPSLDIARPGLSIAPFLQPVIERAMAKKAAARFPDAASMLVALETIDAVSRAVAASASLADTQEAPATKARKGRSWRAAVAVVSLAAGVTTAATLLLRDVPSTTDSTKLVQSPAPEPEARPAPAPPAPEPEARPAPAPPAPEPEAPPAPPPPPSAAIAPPPPHVETAGASRPRARDPWREGVPSALRPIHDRLAHRAHLSQSSLKPAYAYAHQNPSDPRPWLLLARAYAQLDWLSDSVDRYLRAYHTDPTCRGDTQMLADLLKAAEHPVAGRGAAKAVHDIYGAEAIPALEKTIGRRASDRDVTARLERLRQSLSQ
jgi:serine/threonine-protein kinase